MKKFLALLMSLAILATLITGCSKTNSATNSPSPSVAESATASAPVETSAVPSAASSDFKWNGQKEVWSVLPTTNAEGLVVINDTMGAALEAQGWTYVKKDAAGDPTKQVTFVEDALAAGNVGALMVAAMSVDMLQDVIVQANDAGIIVIYLGAEPTQYEIAGCVYTAYELTGMWAVEMAEAWAQKMSTAIDSTGKIPVAIDTFDGIIDGRYRSNAFRDRTKSSDILYVYNEGSSYGDDAQNKGYNWAENMMTSKPELRIFLCYEPDAMIGVCSYLAQYAKENKLDLKDFCVINCYQDSTTLDYYTQGTADPSSTAFKGYVTYGGTLQETGTKLSDEILGVVNGTWKWGTSFYDNINALSTFDYSQHWEMGQDNPALKYKY